MESGMSKKETIIRSALEAYARHGIRDATVRQIADIAGIGKSTVFEYFKSSAELMDAAFEWFIERSSAGRAGIREMAKAAPAKALGLYFDILTGIIISEPEKLLLVSQYVTAIIASGSTFADVKRQYAEKLQPSAWALLEDFRHIVAAGMAFGCFRPAAGLDADDCALLINAIAREMQSQAFVQDEAAIAETCQRLKRIAFAALGIAEEPARSERYDNVL